MVYDLMKEELIGSDLPHYTLGSTRLLAERLNGICFPHPGIEGRVDYINALKKKTSFGDIDVDLEFNVSAKEIAEYLEYNHASATKVVNGEICVAHKINDTDVIQIDLVDIKDKRKWVEFNQFSSFLDINAGLKGLVRDALVKSVARVTPPPVWIGMEMDQLFSRHLGTINKICKVKSNDQVFIDDIRWSFTHTGLKVIACFKKVKNDKILKTVYKTPIEDLEEVKKNLSYNEMNDIADVLGFSNGDVLYHSVLMLDEIKEFDTGLKLNIWREFIQILDTKRPTKTAGGQLSDEEADLICQMVKPYLFEDYL